MDVDGIKTFCLSLDRVFEDRPFRDDTVVYRCMENQKIFVFVIPRGDRVLVNVKNTPGWTAHWRMVYPSIIPGFHMNKGHWNSIVLDGSVPAEVIKELIYRSYELVSGKGK